MKKQATLLSLIFCSILTGCYPTGQKVEKADTSSVVYDEDLNASPREDLRYYFTVPEEYLHTYSAKKAHSVIYEPDYITPLFPGCTENLELEITPETVDSPDLEYYYCCLTRKIQKIDMQNTKKFTLGKKRAPWSNSKGLELFYSKNIRNAAF